MSKNAIDTLLKLSASRQVTEEQSWVLQCAATSLMADEDEEFVELASKTRARTAKPKKKDPKREVPDADEQAEIDRIARERLPELAKPKKVREQAELDRLHRSMYPSQTD